MNVCSRFQRYQQNTEAYTNYSNGIRTQAITYVRCYRTGWKKWLSFLKILGESITKVLVLKGHFEETVETDQASKKRKNISDL